MASRTTQSYASRAAEHPNRLSQKLLEIAESKKTNITLSADLTTTKELLGIAEGKTRPLSARSMGLGFMAASDAD
jgi:orotidine-5'-phosphate decarboxylase